MEAEDILSKIADRMNISASAVRSDVRKEIESLTSAPDVDTCFCFQVQSEMANECTPTDGMIELENSSGGSGGSGGGVGEGNGCFAITETNGTNVTFKNCVFMVGGLFHTELGSGEDKEVSHTVDAGNPVVAIDIDTEIGNASFSDFNSIDAIKNYCKTDKSHYVIPLYEFEVKYDSTSSTYSVSVKRDYRNMPVAAMMEL